MKQIQEDRLEYAVQEMAREVAEHIALHPSPVGADRSETSDLCQTVKVMGVDIGTVLTRHVHSCDTVRQASSGQEALQKNLRAVRPTG